MEKIKKVLRKALTVLYPVIVLFSFVIITIGFIVFMYNIVLGIVYSSFIVLCTIFIIGRFLYEKREVQKAYDGYVVPQIEDVTAIYEKLQQFVKMISESKTSLSKVAESKDFKDIITSLNYINSKGLKAVTNIPDLNSMSVDESITYLMTITSQTTKSLENYYKMFLEDDMMLKDLKLKLETLLNKN